VDAITVGAADAITGAAAAADAITGATAGAIITAGKG